VVRSEICLTGKGDVTEGVGLGDSDWGKGVSGLSPRPDDTKGKCDGETTGSSTPLGDSRAEK
jgi:hypothetical protein